MTCLLACRSCFTHKVVTEKDTLFWKDGWLDGCAPMNLWPDIFRASHYPNGTIHELIPYLDEPPFIGNMLINQIRASMHPHDSRAADRKRWICCENGLFSVKSFYSFLTDGGLRCPVARFFWRGGCPKKINLFN